MTILFIISYIYVVSMQPVITAKINIFHNVNLVWFSISFKTDKFTSANNLNQQPCLVITKSASQVDQISVM